MARKRYNFWLTDQRQDDWAINELITSLKGKGQFTRAIREGLRLWVSLRAGQTDVLCELFPTIAEQLGATVIEKPAPAPPSDGGGHSELAKEIAAQIVLMGGTPGYMMQSAAAPQQQPPTGKQIAAPQFDLPVFDDSDDLPTIEIKKNTDDGSEAMRNSLGSAMALGIVASAPPKAVAKKAKAASADEIADNFLSMF